MAFDFECTQCARVFEAFTKPSVRRRKCECGGNALRLLSCPRIDRLAMAVSVGATATSIDHFDRLHQQQRAKEERCFDRNGDYGKRPGAD
jgi:hypothetical protein